MADTRMIKTKIWSDEWFSELSVDAKLLNIFLLSNKNTHICGYYQISVKEIMFYTGLTQKRIEAAFVEIIENVIYHDGWVIIRNYPRYQNVTNNLKVQASIERALKEIPEYILNLNHKSKSEAIDSLSIGSKKGKTVEKPVGNDKKMYGEFKNVALTDEEKEKLKTKYGKSEALSLVEELSTYIKSKGKRYSSHYATLLAWARRKGLQVNQTDTEPRKIPEMQSDGTVRLVDNPNYKG
jgi:hypothetical protein